MPARVLIVDDDKGIRLLLSRVCRREGYEVSTAVDAFEAYDHLGRSPYDVLICDLNLPGPSGIEILRHARQAQPQVKVIILTGHGDLESAVQAMRLGAFDYIQKPLEDLALIPLAVSRALAQLELERDNANLVSDLQGANRELGQQRDQMLQSIRHIGDVMVAALDPEDIARVLARAIHNATGSDAVGLLLLPAGEDAPIQALTASTAALNEDGRTALVQAMLAEADLTVEPGQVKLASMPAVRLDGDGRPWSRTEPLRFVVREAFLGLAMMAKHHPSPFESDQIEVFAALAGQGAIALDNAYLFERMQNLATRDSLTGLYNHGHFFELLASEISRSERYGYQLAVIMLDIDRAHGLKPINDTYGHQAGDDFLRHVGRVIVDNVRMADSVARYGGDEFIVLAPQTGSSRAGALAHRLCRVVRESSFEIEGNSVSATVSVGAAVFTPGCGETASSLVSRVDKALYAAKERSGNRVIMADTMSPVAPEASD